MAERRHGGRRGDARGDGRGGGRGDLPSEEVARQRDLRDIEIDDLRQQVRDLQRDIEIGDLRRQVRDLQRREERRQKSKPKRSNASERRLMDDPVFDDVCSGQPKSSSNFGGLNKQSDFDHDSIFTSSGTDEPSKNCNSNIFSIPVYDMPVYDEDMLWMPVHDEPVYDKDILSMPVYDEPVYDEDVLSLAVYDEPVDDDDLFSMPVYDKPVYDEDILSMPVYDKPVYDEDIFNELPGLMNKSSPPSVKFDDAAEYEGVAVDDDKEYKKDEFMRRLAETKPQLKSIIVVVFIASKENSSILGVGVDALVKDGLLNDKAINPLELAMEALKVIQSRFYEDFPSHPKEQVYEFATPSTMKPSRWFYPGDGINQIPAKCLVSGDVRLTPFYSATDVIGEILNELRYSFNKADSRTDSRTSLFQEGEYDAVLEELYFWFYLFPS